MIDKEVGSVCSHENANNMFKNILVLNMSYSQHMIGWLVYGV